MIHQRIVSRIRATEQNSLEDKAVVPDGHCMHLEYVDNWVVLGTDKGKVSSLAGAGVEALRNSGLVVHEVEHASKQIKVLGWEFDNNIFRPRPMRVWRVRKAFEYLLQRGSCTGRQLEKIVGHANFFVFGEERKFVGVWGDLYFHPTQLLEQGSHLEVCSTRVEYFHWCMPLDLAGPGRSMGDRGHSS